MLKRIFLLASLLATQWCAAAATPNPYVPSPLETRVIGPSTFLSGSRASLRVVTINHADEKPLRNASVRIALTALDKSGQPTAPQTLFDGKTNQRGTLDASFAIPRLAKGTYQLKVIASAREVGDDTVTQSVQVIERAQILLTTDKPLYQPGQVIHIRALAASKPDNKPVADQPLTLEVEDAKGNKVFKETKNTSKFGVIGQDFTLGNEIGLGRYTVRAIVGDNREEKKITVDRYVLPKFKIVTSTDKKFYQPGETLSGKVQADYFFGKSVAGGEVVIKVATFDVETHQLAELKGKTDAQGAWKFETKLPEALVGQPVNQGNATVTLEIEVKDKAEHKEKNSLSVPVSKDTIRITVVPESGRVIPQVENKFYVLTSLPDGTPVPSRITWKGAGYEMQGRTDAMGVAEVPLTPRGTAGVKPQAAASGAPAIGFGGPVRRGRGGLAAPRVPGGGGGGDDDAENESLQFTVTARDDKGNTGVSEQNIPFAQKDETILVRTSKAVAKVGDEIGVTVLTSRPQGTAYVDIIRDAQTVLTKSVDFAGGKGETKVALDNGMAGTLTFNAYMITSKGEIVRDNKVVYVSAANDLNLKIKPDRETYQPGGQAKISVAVTDRSNRPIAAAMGINIVDESVFALQEMQPGMEKIYFTLERELLKPRYEIHGFEMNEVLGPPVRFGVPSRDSNGAAPDLAPADRQQKAARILFAAAAPRVTPAININTYTNKLEAVMPKWQEAGQRDGRAIWLAAKKYFDKHNSWVTDKEVVTLLTIEKLIDEKTLSDPLGTPYRLSTKQFGTNDLRNGFVLQAAGIDRKFDTSDDVFTMVYQGGTTQPMGNGRDDMLWAAQEGGVRFRRAGALGGGPGGGGGIALGMPAPMAAAPARMLALAEEKKDAAKKPESSASSGDEGAVRIRQFFPETLLSLANLITDDRGHATIDVTMADSITTWRLSALASALGGELGSATAPLKVFQDFFVDIDLPVSLTQNDEVSIPVAVYNYLPEEQKIRLLMEPGDWFEAKETQRTVTLAKGEVSVVYFPIKVKGIGQHTLTVTARGTKLSDAIKRGIEVMPDGQEVWKNVNDRLEPGTIDRTVVIPEQAIAGASNILVRIYPGGFSQVVDGLDKILRMPYG